MIDDLLNLSRVFTTTLSLQNVDITELAQSVLEELQHLNKERRVM